MLINEVYYDAPQPGTDSSYEWLELYNPGDLTVEIFGWSIRDNGAEDTLPYIVLEPKGYAIVAATSDLFANFPSLRGLSSQGPLGPTPEPSLVFIRDGRLGNGLANNGDRLILKDASGQEVDSLSWGDDTSVFNPSIKRAPPGHSIERARPGLVGQGAGDFVDNSQPSPGIGIDHLFETPTPSPSPTTTSTPIPPTATIVLPALTSTVTPSLAPTQLPVAGTPTATSTAPFDASLPLAPSISTPLPASEATDGPPAPLVERRPVTNDELLRSPESTGTVSAPPALQETGGLPDLPPPVAQADSDTGQPPALETTGRKDLISGTGAKPLLYVVLLVGLLGLATGGIALLRRKSH